MRRWLPGFANLLVVLLLMQWGAGIGLCLVPDRPGPAVLCHTDGSAPDGPHKAPGGICPLCAPMPADLVVPPPGVAPPRALPLLARGPVWALQSPLAPARPGSAQPRGPPIPV